MSIIPERKIVLTGDRPSGKLHLGHYAGSLVNRISLQDTCQQIIMIADVQALTDNPLMGANIKNNIYEIVKDYLCTGISYKKNIIFLQSQLKELFELTSYYMNLIKLNQIFLNPTIRLESTQKNMIGDSIPMGFLAYPISQAADITIFNADIVPIGKDQLPVIELTNYIVRKFNSTYKTNFLRECLPYLSKHSKLSGIYGNAKASKSMNNAIFISDPIDKIKEKVSKMYTDPLHIKIEQPGRIEGNVVFEYLDAFFVDQSYLGSLKNDYISGGISDAFVKKILIDCLYDKLSKFHEIRDQITNDQIDKILNEGISNARAIATKNIEQVRKIIFYES